MRFIKRILDRGTVTVPRDVREALGVDEGDIVEFEIVTIVRKKEEKSMTEGSTNPARREQAPSGFTTRRVAQ